MAALESRLESLNANVNDGTEDIKQNATNQLNRLPVDEYERMLSMKTQNFEHMVNSLIYQIQDEFGGLAPEKDDPYYPQKLGQYRTFNEKAAKTLSSLQSTANRYFSKLRGSVQTICGWVRQNRPKTETLIGIGQIFAQLATVIVPVAMACCIS